MGAGRPRSPGLVVCADLAARRAGDARGPKDTYGSTLRVFDPVLHAWRVVWLNPAKQVRTNLIGRRVGDDIVQTGWFGDSAIRWVFAGIARNTFEWRASVLEQDGVTWRLETEFTLARTS